MGPAIALAGLVRALTCADVEEGGMQWLQTYKPSRLNSGGLGRVRAETFPLPAQFRGWAVPLDPPAEAGVNGAARRAGAGIFTGPVTGRQFPDTTADLRRSRRRFGYRVLTVVADERTVLAVGQSRDPPPKLYRLSSDQSSIAANLREGHTSLHVWSARQLELLDVESGLDPSQDGVVDDPLVAEADHGGAFIGDECQAELAVLTASGDGGAFSVAVLVRGRW